MFSLHDQSSSPPPLPLPPSPPSSLSATWNNGHMMIHDPAAIWTILRLIFDETICRSTKKLDTKTTVLTYMTVARAATTLWCFQCCCCCCCCVAIATIGLCGGGWLILLAKFYVSLCGRSSRRCSGFVWLVGWLAVVVKVGWV